MTALNRRQWLKTTGAASALSLLGGFQSLANTTNSLSDDPSELEEIVRLSSNENPYGPSEQVREAMIRAFDKACRYPHMDYMSIVKMIAKKDGVEPENVVVTAGSWEGLKMTGLIYGIQRGEIIAADPVYKSLLTYAEHFGAYINRVPLNDKMEHDLEEMERRISQNTSLVFLCNPSNPSGTLLEANKFKDFCRTVSDKTLVFSDEAYFDYITVPNYPSMIELVKEGKNVIVSRTFSKVYGLAGIRIGYLVARPDIISRLIPKRMAGPNMLAIHAAKAALKDKAFYQFSLKKNEEAKNIIYETLDDLNLEYAPSHTNFVFFKTGRPIQAVQIDLKNTGVQVGRPFPPLTDWCRVSTGTIEQVEKLARGLREVFG